MTASTTSTTVIVTNARIVRAYHTAVLPAPLPEIHPLVEERVEAPAARALDGALEIGGRHRLAGVLPRVVANRVPERGLAQRGRAARAGPARPSGRRARDRRRWAGSSPGTPAASRRPASRMLLDAPPPSLDVGQIGVAAARVLLVGGRHERREAFVQPEVRPLAVGDEIAPPLVRQLVGDERGGRGVGRAPSSVGLGHVRQPGQLLSAARRDERLRVRRRPDTARRRALRRRPAIAGVSRKIVWSSASENPRPRYRSDEPAAAARSPR